MPQEAPTQYQAGGLNVVADWCRLVLTYSDSRHDA